MILRHVEALRGLGFDAACLLGAGSVPPKGIEHSAPLLPASPVERDDIIVLPDDAQEAIRFNRGRPERAVIFSQGGYTLPAIGAEAIDLHLPEALPPFIAVSERSAAQIRRIYPGAQVEIVPCFADERLFTSRREKRFAVAYTPIKRPFESAAIRGLFARIHTQYRDLEWSALGGMSEAAFAHALGSSGLYLSLSRLESVGLTTLEAMATGAVCAGFLGGGGGQYGTPANGFWVSDDDCDAAADALAEAADLFMTGGPPLEHKLEAARATAAEWSYARFRDRLEAAWMRIAPEARRL